MAADSGSAAWAIVCRHNEMARASVHREGNGFLVFMGRLGLIVMSTVVMRAKHRHYIFRNIRANTSNGVA